MASDEQIIRLFKFEVGLNQESKIVIDYERPPDSDEIEKAFDDWNEDYEHTKKIVSLVKYLRDYGNKQCDDIQRFIS